MNGDHIRDEILMFLGDEPQKLREKGFERTAQLTVQLGNTPTDPWADRMQEQLELMHTRLKNLEVKTVKGGAK